MYYLDANVRSRYSKGFTTIIPTLFNVCEYWFKKDQPYTYISVPEFVNGFKSFHIGQRLDTDLKVPYDKSKAPKDALVREKYGISTS